MTPTTLATAPYACHPDESRGRPHREAGSDVRGPRNIFQRDRDRIIHSISFRRLRHKTQVFVSPDGDHYRVRLTHSLEVAQIGRTIARALGLNEDLTEALCLAHDIGHPPFGHAGEDALEAALQPYGGFDHNAQTLRTLMKLDSPYPLWPGLNLSWELLEGLAKHNGPVDNPGWALKEANDSFDLNLSQWSSLEAQIAAVADDIAYDNHDIDDGIRAGLLSVEQLCELPFVAERWQGILARYPGVAAGRLLPELVREQIGVMVNDVIAATQQRISETGVINADDIRQAGQMIGGFSPQMAEQERSLKKFMYANLYHHPTQVDAAARARKIIEALYGAYMERADCLPAEWRAGLPTDEPKRSRYIADFLAGMTDRYAENRYCELFGEQP
ncbi:deoxyguanosinetriphosphate triphosphohydrolase [Sphingorhabdus arenilitoris]|uniref:Deoxyguanosinetriphosphate triphosphohydrolase-like protein n=1 Tax=Sphingorhabdus arenilitoris TaxID=1490041 RepID=A0ABV8RFX1_9SPHN